MSKDIKYPNCSHIPRCKPNLEVTQEIAEEIGRDYRTIPIFEKGLFEFKYKNHYSLERNAYLKCRWAEFKKTFEKRIREPVRFPNVRDYHFYNCRNRLMPSISIFNAIDYKMKLGTGPGVDFRGQMPIPQELFMKRGAQVKKEKPKRVTEKKEIK